MKDPFATVPCRLMTAAVALLLLGGCFLGPQIIRGERAAFLEGSRWCTDGKDRREAGGPAAAPDCFELTWTGKHYVNALEDSALPKPYHVELAGRSKNRFLVETWADDADEQIPARLRWRKFVGYLEREPRERIAVFTVPSDPAGFMRWATSYRVMSETIGGDIVLTGPGKQLKAFLVSMARNEVAFEPRWFYRMNDPDSAVR